VTAVVNAGPIGPYAGGEEGGGQTSQLSIETLLLRELWLQYDVD